MNKKVISRLGLPSTLRLRWIKRLLRPSVLGALLATFAATFTIQSYNSPWLQKIKKSRWTRYSGYYFGHKAVEALAFIALARYKPSLVAQMAGFARKEASLLCKEFAPRGIKNPLLNCLAKKFDKKMCRLSVKYTNKARTQRLDSGAKQGKIITDLSKVYDANGPSSIQPFRLNEAQRRSQFLKRLGENSWSPIFNGPIFSPGLNKETLV